MPGNSNGNDSAEAFIEDAMSSLDRTALERNNVIELVVKNLVAVAKQRRIGITKLLTV